MDYSNDLELLKYVQMFPHLFNKREPLYKNKKAKQNAWETISSLMNATAKNCEQRFSILRNRYCTEKRTKRNMPPGSGASKCSWPLYEVMEFLDEFIVPRRTQMNLTTIDSMSNYEEVSPISTTPTKTNGPMASVQSHEIKAQNLRLDAFNKRQKTNANFASTIQETFINTNKQIESSDDEETAFYNSVAAAMRKIKSKKRRYIVKSKIMTILAEAVSDSE